MIDIWFGLCLTLGGVVTIGTSMLLGMSLLVSILSGAGVALYGAVTVLKLNPHIESMRIWRIGITANALALVGIWNIQLFEASLPLLVFTLFTLAVGVSVIVDTLYHRFVTARESRDE